MIVKNRCQGVLTKCQYVMNWEVRMCWLVCRFDDVKIYKCVPQTLKHDEKRRENIGSGSNQARRQDLIFGWAVVILGGP